MNLNNPIRKDKGTLFFVEMAQTGSGCMHLRWAYENGFDVWLVTTDEAKYANLPDNSVVSELADQGRVCTVKTTEGLTLPKELLCVIHGITGKIGVVCVSDRNLLFAARLAQALGAPFVSVEAMECMRDKRAARTLFDELNLPTAKWCAPLSVEDVRNFSSNIEGGVVIKNCRGTGSLDVRLCTGEEDTVDNFLEMSAQPRYLDGDLMLEEFLYGPLVSMEILVVQGQAIVLGVTDRQLGPLPDFCEVSYTFPIVLPDSDIGIMAEAVDALVSRLRISQGFLHVEFIVTNSGPKLVEVNPRLGGGLLAKMMDDCLTVSISELVCTSALDVIDTVPLQNGKASSTTTVYPRRSGRLRSLDGMQRVMNSPFVCEVVEVARIGDEIESAKDYRGAVCQIRATAGSSALAFNSVQTAAQLIVIELME